MTRVGGKRLFKDVAVAELDDGYGILLDEKSVRTPKRHALRLPTRPLADAIAAEWQAQRENVDPKTMPLTRLAGSAIDLVAPNRAEVIERTAAYAATDLLCYRAEGPRPLMERQDRSWQPLIDWAGRRFSAPLAITRGIMAVDQPEETLRALTLAVDSFDDMRLTALAAATAECGSLVLALALAEREIDAETAFELSQLDETYQIELWGEDPEAAARRNILKADIAAAAHFLRLLEV
ncbi:MAG TPA: ATP12 family protein [Alphaproteobacteria bacterium]|nr:ATP12 family protein [Alphaproteobacteria bacterium]